MKKVILSLGILFTLSSNLEAREVTPDTFSGLVCEDLKTESQAFPNKVTVALLGSSAQRPLAVVVDGLPEGNGIGMNFQDIFGKGKQTGGTIVYASKDQGDGTIQDYCGADKFNALIHVNQSAQIYCAACASR